MVPKANLWIINYCILEMKADNELAISLPVYFNMDNRKTVFLLSMILSLSKNEMFYEKNKTKQKDQKKKKKGKASIVKFHL